MREKIIIMGGNIIGYGIVRALKHRNPYFIIASSNLNDFCQFSKYVEEYHFLPNLNSESKAYFKKIIELGKKHKGALLVPANDGELLFLLNNKKKLEKYFKVFCGDYESQKIFLEKDYTYKLCEEIGIPSPKTFYPESLDDFDKLNGKIPFPAIIKPVLSHEFVAKFSVKLFKAKSFEELRIHFKKSHKYGCKVMVQEYIDTTRDGIFDICIYREGKGDKKTLL